MFWVVQYTSPPTSRFPSALERSLAKDPRDNSRASGNLSGISNPIHLPPLASVGTQCHFESVHHPGILTAQRRDCPSGATGEECNKCNKSQKCNKCNKSMTCNKCKNCVFNQEQGPFMQSLRKAKQVFVFAPTEVSHHQLI